MTSPEYRVRRATVEDLAGLRALWNSMHYATEELEKRLTEFQVVVDASGHLAGALGVQLARPHAHLHSEAYVDFTHGDEMRAVLLERIRALASNHGVLRLWTREKSPFWTQHGFRSADPEVLKKLPQAWAGRWSAWLTLQLKDEEAIVSLEKEMGLLMEAEKRRTARLFRHAHTLKSVATLLAIIFAIFVLYALFYLVRKNPDMLHFGR